MKKLIALLVLIAVAVLMITNLSDAQTKSKQEWVSFRGNEEGNKGKVVTWKCVFKGTTEFQETIGYFKVNEYKVSRLLLENDYKRVVYVDGFFWSGGKYGATTFDAWEKAGKVRENDVVLVKGEFVQVTSDGGIFLKPIKINKVGFVD